MVLKIPWISHLSLYILIYVSNGYDTCWRKSGLYNDVGMVIQDDVVDKKSSLAFKYLSIAEKREQSRLLHNFNWTEIKQSVKDEFNRSCNLGNDSYLYNYTLVFETSLNGESEPVDVTIISPTEETSTMNTTEISPTTETITTGYVQSTPTQYNNSYNYTDELIIFLSAVLGVNESSVSNYILENIGNSSIKLSGVNEPSIEMHDNGTFEGSIQFPPHGKCDNVFPERVKFSTVNTSTGFKVRVSLEGLSISEGNFSSSSDTLMCIKENMGNKSYKVHVESSCEHCSMKFMARVTSVPESFNNTMKEIGIVESNLTNSFYLCSISGESECSEFISFDAITLNKTIHTILKTVDGYNHSISRRSVDFKTTGFTTEELDCMHNAYPEPTDCSFVNIRKRRSDRNPKKDSDNDFMSQARKQLGNKPVIPPKVTHLQTGIHKKSESGVSGDGAIYSEVKKNVKTLIRQMVPVVPSSGKPEDLYATITKQPKLPPSVKSNVFTEAIRSTIEQKQSSVSEVLYAELEFSSKRPSVKDRYQSTIYSSIDFSRRTSVSSIDSEPDFVDIKEVRKQLEHMRLGDQTSRGVRRMSSTTSESDFEDIEDVRRQLKSMGYGKKQQDRRMSSTSSESDFEDINEVISDYKRLKEQSIMRKGVSPIDPAGNKIAKSLEGKAIKIQGIDIVKRPSPPDTPVMIKNVDTGSVITTPFTRKGAIRRPKQHTSSPKVTPQLDDNVYFSPARTPQFDDEIYMEGPTNGKPKYMSPANRPLPPIPPRQASRDYLPVPPSRTGGGRSLSSVQEEPNPSSGAIPKAIHRRCRRSIDGVVCSMLQRKPVDSTYSLASAPKSPYSLAGHPDNRVYEEILGIPAENVKVVDKKALTRGNINSGKVSSYKGTMKHISSSFDKSMVFGGAMLLAGQQAIQQQSRQSVLQRKDQMSEGEKVLEAVTMSLSTLGTTLTSAGMVAGPKLMAVGMSISAISGIIDTVKDIYYMFSNDEKPVDPVIKLFNTYSGYINDREKSGVRKCMVPGEDMMIYMAYSNNSKSFKPEMEKTALYFLDVIDSQVLYMNTSNVILDYQLRVACPIGVLRSPDTDITAYTTMYAEDDGVKKYMFTRLGVMLSRTPTVRLTCGRDTTLTISPYEVPISNMQLLKMVTPGEPNSTRNIPSDVCDKYPLKKFYLLAEGCPYDTSQTFIVHTTCSILLRMSTWDPFRNRWVLQNPFRQEGEYKQLFTFSKYDFNNTIIDPNNKAGHASFCINRQSRQCYWSESMILENVDSCQARSRKIYVKIRVFGDRGFDSFVLTCPSGSTPVSVGGNNSIIELPVGDYGTSKLFASIQDNKIGVFCVHNYDKRFKSDMIVLIFEKNKYDYGVKIDNFDSRALLFSRLSVGMPYRSRNCDNRREGCYRGGVDFKSPDVDLDVHHGVKEIMLKETYDANSIDPQVVVKAKEYFPSAIKVKFTVNNLGNAYKRPDKFWEDAIAKKRTYSSILVNISPCTSRNKNIYIDNPISTMGYLQSLTKDYGDGSTYHFKKVNHNHYNRILIKYNADCSAVLDLKSREMTVECNPLSIPRSEVKNYEGLCFSVVTSRDHCATETDWMKLKGYDSWDATVKRTCFYDAIAKTASLDHYCSYSGDLYNYYPDYDACKSYIFVEYRDTWIESEVLQQPPYTFEFRYDKSNSEYVNKELSDRMNELYDEYKKLLEYTDGSLPNSINRLAKSLTKEAREITSVNIDGNILELAYQADKEKIAEIQDKISEITKEIFANTLSEADLIEIMESAENDRCCIIDVHNNKTEKYYPLDNYMCGEVSDYVYMDEENRKYVLINNTYIPYDYLNQSEAVVSTCYNASIIPLHTKEARKMAEDAIISSAVAEALNEIFDEIDTNISLALINEEENYLSSQKSGINLVGYTVTIVLLIIVVLIITLFVYVWFSRSKKYNVIKTKYVSDTSLELDTGSYASLSTD
ncbi:MPPV-134 variola B22R-like protein [Magpiepox virus 2]|nr:MPPV-134 variola B22R-like protein [Magpiepox virus 2]